MNQHTTPATATRPARTGQGETLPARLLAALLIDTPARASLMTDSGEPKYRDAPKGYAFKVADLVDHLNGTRTWAATLGASNGTARSGVRDYDKMNARDAEAKLCEALEAAKRNGITAAAIFVPGNGAADSGGHLWTLYAKPAPVADIRGQLATLPGAKGEIYPSGNPIRLLGGYHRTKRTFGTLILQDGRRFDLNDAGERQAGLAAFLALPRNTPPPTAPAEASNGGAAFGEHHKAEYWENLPDGGQLMESPRYKALFSVRTQLAQIQRGERVVLYRDGIADDSDSAQVAALVFNLITSKRKNADGTLPAAGVGAPPESEIRAVALHWKATLRPNRTPEHYIAHVDSEIARYRPATYQPEATKGVTIGVKASEPTPLQPAQHRGRPAGQRAEQVERMVNILYDWPVDPDGVRRPTREKLSKVLSVTPRMVTAYLADAETAGYIDTKPDPRALAITRVEINSIKAEGGNRSNEQSAVSSIPTPENVVLLDDAIRIGETPRAPAPVAQRESPRGSVSPLPEPTPEPQPALVDALPVAVAKAFEALREAPRLVRAERQDVDQETGEIIVTPAKWKAPPIRCAAVVAWLDEHYPEHGWSEAAIDEAISNERKLGALPKMKLSGLKAELRFSENAATQSRAQGTNAWRWWTFYAAMIRAEMRCRPAEQGKRKKRAVVEALPDLRTAGEVKQQELLELVELDRAKRAPAKRTPAAAVIGNESPQGLQETDTAPIVFRFNRAPGDGLIARLTAAA